MVWRLSTGSNMKSRLVSDWLGEKQIQRIGKGGPRNLNRYFTLKG